MKEEIFLFYREHLEPRLRVLKCHLFSIPLVQRLFGPEKEKEIPFEYRYVLVEGTEHSLHGELGISPIVLSDPKSAEGLDPNHFLFLLGQYDEVIFTLNYLRSLGYKALWDQTTMEVDNLKPIWKRRVSVVEAIYADLITEKIRNKGILMDEKNEWIDFENQIFNTYTENKEEYKTLIGEYLKEGWDLSRINPITVSIILEAISEYQSLRTAKLVLITQSVKTAKNYCGEEDYKIINAILDNYFRAND